MPVLPSAASFRVLLACTEAVQSQHRWVNLTVAEVPGLEGLSPEEVQEAAAELTRQGYCAPVTYGERMYITREGAKLAKVARDLMSQGLQLAELTIETLAPALVRFPYFRLPEEFATRSASSPVVA
jgi:hypothetical protein